MFQRQWDGPENLVGEGWLCDGFPAIKTKQAKYQGKVGNVWLKCVKNMGQLLGERNAPKFCQIFCDFSSPTAVADE